MARRPNNYYELLGVPPDASRDQIHSAYRRLARRYHPDLNAGGEDRTRFHELSDAYEVLHDPAERARYDRSTLDARRAVNPTREPFFSTGRARDDVPRFLDEEPGGGTVRFGLRPGVRIQLVVRWLR
jgi:curved DNA-binding protein